MLTVLSGSVVSLLVYSIQPGRLNGVELAIVLIVFVLLIPLTLSLLVSTFSRRPANTFKAIIKVLAVILGYLSLP